MLTYSPLKKTTALVISHSFHGFSHVLLKLRAYFVPATRCNLILSSCSNTIKRVSCDWTLVVNSFSRRKLFSRTTLILPILLELVRARFPRYQYEGLVAFNWKTWLIVCIGAAARLFGFLLSLDRLPSLSELFYLDTIDPKRENYKKRAALAGQTVEQWIADAPIRTAKARALDAKITKGRFLTGAAFNFFVYSDVIFAYACEILGPAGIPVVIVASVAIAIVVGVG